MSEGHQVAIDGELDVVAARVEGRNLAREIGFAVIDQARIATVISELTRNVILYAGKGQITLSRMAQGERAGLEIICEDQGPGIADVNAVLNNEDSEMHEEGMGLPGARRLMDDFEIQSQIGVGTRVIARKWLSEHRQS